MVAALRNTYQRPHQIPPTSISPPTASTVCRDARRSSQTTEYYSDVSNEHQPPGETLLTWLNIPSPGGDTAWVSQVAAYERWSDRTKRLLEKLRAEHSGLRQAEMAGADGKFMRREPVRSEYPVARVHPVTGEKALFGDPGFRKRIIGLSNAILQLPFKHISVSQDIQVRVKWDGRMVSLWDNRLTAHRAISN